MYENFDLYSSKASCELTKQTSEFQNFLSLGKKIAKRIREIVPEYIDVYYWDEGNDYRYRILSDGSFQENTPKDVKGYYDSSV
jgi:hypothetical protein